MAAPSEAITWKRLRLSPPERFCAVCGVPMTLDMLRQYHVTEGVPRTLKLACRDCGPVLA